MLFKDRELLIRSGFGTSERGRTIGSGGVKSSMKQPTALERIREKTMEMRLKK
jgi:hypothetical protein